MARAMIDDGAVPMPCELPIQQPPYYMVSPPVSPIPQHSGAPQYVYYPNASSGYGVPVSNAVALQDYYHPYPVYNILPPDARRNELRMQDACENATRQEKQPRVPRVQPVPQQWIYPPAHLTPDGAIVGQPLQVHRYPMYRVDDAPDTSHLRSDPSGIQFVNSYGVPLTPKISAQGQSPAIAMSGSQPYILPAPQPGMQWKLVPIADPDPEKFPGMIPKAMPAASKAPLMLMASPGSENATNDCAKPDSSPLKLKIGDDVHPAKSEDPYSQILSLLFPKSGAKHEVREDVKVDGPSSPKTVSKIVSEKLGEKEKVEPTIPKSIRIIPVTDPPEEKSVADPTKEKSVAEPSKEKSVSQVKKSKKSSAPVLKPIKLVPSLDFVKKKDSNHANGFKEEKQVAPGNHAKPESHQIPSHDRAKEEVPARKAPMGQAHEAAPKAEVVVTSAKEKPVSPKKVTSGVLKDMECDIAEPQGAKKHSSNVKVAITSSETAARVIQSVWRGHLVRRHQPLKHLRDIARVKLMLKDYQTLLVDKNEFLKKCVDPVERNKISEGLMSLLLQLDSIQGVDPVVRDIRKYTSKEVLKLQSEVDAATQVVIDKADHVSTELSMLAKSTDVANNDFAVNQESNSAEPSHNVDCRDAPVSNGEEMVMTRSEETENKIHSSEPIEICKDRDALVSDDTGMVINERSETACETQPIVPQNNTGQTEERVGDLLRKLLNRLPDFESHQEPETVNKRETLIDADDLTLISEVVKRLSVLEEQRSIDTEKKQLNERELPPQLLAPGLLYKGEELIMSDTSSSANFSGEGLHSNISVGVELTGESGKSSDASGKEDKLLIPEPATSPSESELHNLRKGTSDDPDAAINISDDMMNPAQSTPDEESGGGQNAQTINATILQEKLGVGNGSLPKPMNLDAIADVTEIPHCVIVGDQEDIERGQKRDNDEESPAVRNFAESGILPREADPNSIGRNSDTDILERDVAIRPEFEGEETSLSLHSNQCETDNQSNTSCPEHKFGSNELVRHESNGDIKTDQVSALVFSEESNENNVAVDDEASDNATGLDSTTSFDNEVFGVPEGESTIDGAPQQLTTADGVLGSPNVETFDSSQKGQLSLNEENEKDNKTEDDIDIENGPQLSVAACVDAEHLGIPCNDSSSSQNSLDGISRSRSGIEVIPVVGSNSFGGVVESGTSESEPQMGVAKSSDQSVVPESVDVTEGVNVQTSDKCLTPEKKITETNSPTSILDTANALHSVELIFTESTTDIVRDESTSEMPSIVATMAMQESTQNSPSSIEDLQQESTISHLQSPNLEEQVSVSDQLTQLESAISDLQNLNNRGQGYLDNLNPAEELRDARSSMSSHSPTSKRIAEDIHIPNPISLSAGALHVLRGSAYRMDESENHSLTTNSPSSDSESSQKNLTQHLIEENTILKAVLRDVLKWSQWQSSATMRLHKMIENLEHKIPSSRHTPKRRVKTAKLCGLPKRKYEL